MALSQWQHTLWGNRLKKERKQNSYLHALGMCNAIHRFLQFHHMGWSSLRLSQRSLHSAPIFRLLLKVAVNGTHQCDFHNFCGALCSNKKSSNVNIVCILNILFCDSAMCCSMFAPMLFIAPISLSLRKGQ